MSLKKWLSFAVPSVCAVLLAAAAVFAAPPNSPIVTMRVTLPDGQVKSLQAHESGVATVTARDGTEFGFRPTIEDAAPWQHVTVTIFRMPTAAHAAEEVGAVEVRAGAHGVKSTTSPAFTIAVEEVSATT